MDNMDKKPWGFDQLTDLAARGKCGTTVTVVHLDGRPVCKVFQPDTYLSVNVDYRDPSLGDSVVDPDGRGRGCWRVTVLDVFDGYVDTVRTVDLFHWPDLVKTLTDVFGVL